MWFEMQVWIKFNECLLRIDLWSALIFDVAVGKMENIDEYIDECDRSIIAKSSVDDYFRFIHSNFGVCYYVKILLCVSTN